MYGHGHLSLREELRAAADNELAAATEPWPANRVFGGAADQLYGDLSPHPKRRGSSHYL